MGDEETNQPRRSERINKSKRPARFDQFELDQPQEKMPRIDSPSDDDNINETIRQAQQNEANPGQQQLHPTIPPQPNSAPPQPDLLSQMKEIMSNMAATIQHSIDSMETKIEDSRTSLQSYLTSNMNVVNSRIDDVQKHMEVSIQEINARFIHLEKNTSTAQFSNPPQSGVFGTSSTFSNGSNSSLGNDLFVRQLSKTLSDINAHRKLIDLPKFSGEPEEWPQFIAQYKSTTEREQYSTVENNIRLANALQGKAKDLVQSLLIHHSNVDSIIQRLERRFGLPHQLAESQLAAIKRVEAITENCLHRLVPFADKVMNLRNFLENAGCSEYLNSPSLLKDLTLKLPYRERITWTHHSRGLEFPTLKEFSDWLISLADDIHCTVADEPSEKKRRVMYAEVISEKCICCSEFHLLKDCPQFKEMPYESRFQTARSHGVCFCCLIKGHIIAKCPTKKMCEVPGCKRMHHDLLHKEMVLDPSAKSFIPTTASGTVMNCRSVSGVKVWFKIVPVKIYGPNGIANVFALFDEGASVTMLDKKVAMQIGATGQKSTLNLKWLNDESRHIKSVTTQLKVSGNFPNANKFDLHDVHIVDNMKLPQQTLKLNELPSKYKQIRNLPIQEFSNVTPSLLIGLDNASLGRASTDQNFSEDGPIIIQTKLGYVLYGAARNEQSHSSSHILLTRRSQKDDTLQNLITDYFSTENFGVKVLPPLISDDTIRANQILERTTIMLNDKYQSGLLWRKDEVNFSQ